MRETGLNLKFNNKHKFFVTVLTSIFDFVEEIDCDRKRDDEKFSKLSKVKIDKNF